MNILRTDPEAFAQTAAALIASVIRAKPDARLVVATGNTPIKPYQELAKLREQGELDCSSLHVFQMDAYADVSPQDPRSLQGWTRRSFIKPLHIPEKKFYANGRQLEQPRSGLQSLSSGCCRGRWL
jgi:glucosamine-6-phosphate deaminase